MKKYGVFEENHDIFLKDPHIFPYINCVREREREITMDRERETVLLNNVLINTETS